jgi:N-acetylmuramoyl-L-alanine amidase
VLVVACVASAGAAPGRELRAVRLTPATDGATVVIELTRPTIPRFAVVRGDDGALRRIHVDLPDDTAIAGGVVAAEALSPVVRVRAGLVDGNRPRIVIDVDGATDYRLDDDAPPGTIHITIVGPVAPATTPPASATSSQAQSAPGPPERVRAKTQRSIGRAKIVLDPGHGGDDPGAEGFAVEKAMTLDIAQRLATLLRQRLGAEVVLTRERDETLPLKARTAQANAEGADLFVSIHANASPAGRLRGIETYYLDNSTDHATLRLAKLENGLDLLRPKNGEANLRYILSDLVQVGKLDQSVRLARSVQRGLVTHLRSRYPGIVDLGVKRGPFYVLVGAYMPCVLVETAFLTHPVEGRRLARDEYRADVAQGLYTGIAGFVADIARRRTL